MTSAEIDMERDAEIPAADRREVEWQLTASDLEVVRRWLVSQPIPDGWQVEPCATLQLQDTYFDTGDWRLFRSGFALRVRDAAGTAEATLKGLQSASATHMDRRELTEPLSGAGHESLLESAGPVAVRVHAVAGTQPLRPLFEVRTSRQRFLLRRDDGAEALGEVALDDTVISRPDGVPQASLQRVEVEALAPGRENLEGFVDRLRRDCTLLPAADSKFEIGLNSVGMVPPSVPELGADPAQDTMRVGELALASLRRNVSAWIEHEPGARLGEDPEALHDLRVAGRRIDATIKLFAPFLPARWVRMRSRLKALMRTFGEVRDLDNALAELAQFEHELPESERGALASFRRHLESKHAQARVRMLRALDAPSTQHWFERVKLTCVQPTILRAQRAQPLAVAVLPDLVRARYRKCRKAAQRLTPDSPADEYHALRGKVKRLRYTVETVAELYGKPAEQFLRALKPLQNRLGEQQDAHVSQERLSMLARQSHARFPAATTFLMGRLAERKSVSGAHARDSFEKAYRRLHRKGWKRLRRKLDERSASRTDDKPEQTDSATKDAASAEQP